MNPYILRTETMTLPRFGGGVVIQTVIYWSNGTATLWI